MIGVLKAAFVAIRYGKGKRLKRIRDFLLLVRATLTQGKADAETYARRMAFCRACPVYFKKYQTCGSPLSEYSDLGCWCHMPTKSKLKAASCWIRQNAPDQPWGWPQEISHV